MPVVLAEHHELLRLKGCVRATPPIVTAEIRRRAFAQNESELRIVERSVELNGAGTSKAELLQRLLSAIKRLDAQGWRQTFHQLIYLHAQRKEVQRRYELLERLEKVAPAWATTLEIAWVSMVTRPSR